MYMKKKYIYIYILTIDECPSLNFCMFIHEPPCWEACHANGVIVTAW